MKYTGRVNSYRIELLVDKTNISLLKKAFNK